MCHCEDKMNKIKFNFNTEKSIEVILYFANKIENITHHKLFKLMFYADIYHINKYNRPITGDNYIAMQYGPVPSIMRDILTENDLYLEALPDELPFVTVKVKNKPIIKAFRESNNDYFSGSDIEAMNHSIDKYKNLNFQQLTDISHDHPAWINAWDARFGDSSTIDYEDFFEEINKANIEELKEIAPYICM